MLIVFISLIAGYIAGQFYKNRPDELKKIRIYLQRGALLFINPLAFLGAMWIAPVKNLSIMALPFIAALAIISGGVMAYLYSRMKKLGRRQTGSLIPVGAFTNIGSIGGIIVYFFLGEAGFSLVPIYKIFEELLYYGVGFPIARSYSGHRSERDNRLKLIIKDPFIMTMLTAIFAGLVLNLSGMQRPGWYAGLNSVLIPLATVMLLLSIGMAFQFTRMRDCLGHASAIAVIKALLVPAFIFTVASVLGMGKMENGLVLRTILILSAMPSGFISLVPPTIYDLDIHLSNTAWIASMLSLLITVPLLALLLPLVG